MRRLARTVGAGARSAPSLVIGRAAIRVTWVSAAMVLAAASNLVPITAGRGAGRLVAHVSVPQNLPETPTVEDFDTVHSPYVLGTHVLPPEPTQPARIVEDPPGNHLMRLATYAPPIQSNSINFDRTTAGYICRAQADFDLRMTLAPGKGRADGIGFALLNTANYGTEGVIPPQPPLFASEEPNFAGSLGVGFDIYQSPGEASNDHLSVHFNGSQLSEVGLLPFGLDLASGTWIHTRVLLTASSTESRVSVTLTPSGGSPVAAVTNMLVPGLTPYEARVQFAGRSGGESANHDLDNVNVAFSRCGRNAEGPPAVLGQWSDVIDLQEIAIHAHLLPNGKILYWDRSDYATPGTPYDSGSDGIPRLWDPANAADPPVKLTGPGYDLFCTGHAFLADGRLLAVGGHTPNADLEGLPRASVFDPLNNSWAALPDMNAGRWYPTATALRNGDVLTVDGTHWDGTLDANGKHNIVHNILPQVLSRKTGQWVNLSSAQLLLDFYPYTFLAPDGRVFYSGPLQQTRLLDTTGTGSWTDVASSAYGRRDYGSAVLYDTGKVMIVGGSRDRDQEVPTNSAETIDLTASSPGWSQSAPMAYRRRQHTATILADGKVLVTGGSTRPGLTNASGSVLMPELWDPGTRNWSLMAEMQVPRLYHSTALLLPDGRVFSAGGGHPRDSQNNDPDHPNAEIYSPPYLFKGARPQIASAPTSVTYGKRFFVGTPDAAGIQNVTWIALGSDSHGFDESQRINRLTFTTADGGLQVTAPTDPNLSPPGYYMLFLLNNSGVPSISKIVRIDRPTAAADFDASTTTDISVFRPSNGAWFVRGGTTAVWGTSGDIPAPADYDGNGHADIAVFRPSTGTWYVRGGATAAWGASGDIPVPGDFNGDGVTDIAVFRPSTGTWYVRGGTTAVWGATGDDPLP